MKFFYSVLIALSASFAVKAAPGDTTWVQAHNSIWLDNYNDFDTTVNFPDGATKYRKIIMVFTLGKYVCPGTPRYCADWDYTVQTYAMNKKGDTVELGRLITPYANSARMTASWSQPYYFDVTDFSTVLKDSNKIRIHYSGYSGGFTANVRFALVEGTPERNVIGIRPMWNGNFSFGNPADPIDAHFTAQTITPPAGTEAAVYRINITGHGSDLNGCSEFCEKYYRVIKDGSVVREKTIWRDNCGLNNFYPQNGTWVYDRGNWCPGDLVHTIFHPLPSVSGGASFNLGMGFESYTRVVDASVTSMPVYTVSGAVVYYGPLNKTLDASMEDIIAPTNNQHYFRENARIGYTTVKIKNTGSSVINNMDIEYGVSGEPLTKTFWTGTIAPLSDTVIDLPYAVSLFKATGTNIPYEVTIVKVNGAADDDAVNNKFTSKFDAAPEWPATFTVVMRTNLSTRAGVSETEWKIINGMGAVVAERINNDPSKMYLDTIRGLPADNYKLIVTDKGCDGLSWWANAAAGAGSLQVKPAISSTVPLPKYFGGDFGCGFVQDFRVGSPTAITEIAAGTRLVLSVYPNPARDEVFIHLDGAQSINGILTITDNTGRKIRTDELNDQDFRLDTQGFTNGLYFISYKSAAADQPALLSKLVIVQ